MTGKRENRSRLRAALKALKVKQRELLAWRDYGDQLVLVTRRGRKLIWQAGNRQARSGRG
jgi:hypothetical protein